MDAQHALQADWPSTGTLRLRIIGFDHFAKLFPRNDLFHLIQKMFLAGLLTVFLKTCSF